MKFAHILQICQHIHGSIKKGEKKYLGLVKLWKEDPDQGPVLLIDDMVYTKNRHMRTLGSTKYGAANDLRLSGRFYKTQVQRMQLITDIQICRLSTKHTSF